MEAPGDSAQQSKGGNNDAAKRHAEGKSSTSPLKQQRTDTLPSGKGKKDAEGTGPDNTAIWDLGGTETVGTDA